jgi:solute carrier family 25 uncoupling protein 8/9
MRNDGPLAFYKGFIPNFGRLGSWNVVMFLTLEQVKKQVRDTQSCEWVDTRSRQGLL